MDKRHTTSETPRVPSNVPNDHDHLPAPGSLNIPLGGKGRKARRRSALPGWAKALLAVGTALIAFGLVALVIGIIVFPPFYRNLEPRYQQRILDIFPLATYFKPTVAFEVLPTLGGGADSDAAQHLLEMTDDTGDFQTPQPAADVTEEALSAGDDEPAPPPPADTSIPAPTEGGIPVGLAPTQEPTMLPTYAPPTQAAIEPTWTPNLEPTAIPLPVTHRLDNIRYELQGWNNCGPATMTMALSYYGWTENQYPAARWMKPHTEDKNVSPWQMVRFVNENTGVKALYRIGGTTQLLKHLVAAGFPVIIEEGFQPAGEDWMGHYLLLMGYDDNAQQFLAFDSYLGSNQGNGKPHPYSVFDEWWRHFNRIFIVIYEPSREMELRGVLGDYVDPEYAARAALEKARAEAAQQDDKWAWFNMGTAYNALGMYSEAAMAFDLAMQRQLPWRMLWYQFGPYEAYYHEGRYNDVLTLAETNRSITPYVEETHYWEGMVHAAQGNSSRAVQKFNEALNYNRNFFPAQEAKAQVENGTFQLANVNQ